jgi:nicotinate-nucleotide adenylyltransferase
MVIPTGNPYLRASAPIASGTDRLEMASAALDDLSDELQEKVMVLDIEVRREGPTYSVETLGQLSGFFPRDKFTLILGSDAAAHFESWKRAADIKKSAEILVVKRPGDARSAFEEITIDALDISSTMVRSAIASGSSVDSLLSPSVARYINERGLYARK